MKKTLSLFLALICLISCAPELDSNSFYYVTKLGNDTLAIEKVIKSEYGLTADVVLRSPRISLTRYEINWDDNNKLTSMTSIRFDQSFDETEGNIIQSLSQDGDSLNGMAMGRNGEYEFTILNDPTLLPFIDMVHWPFDVAFSRAMNVANDSIDQYLLSGRRKSNFIIHRVNNTDYTLRHPSRGVMHVKVGEGPGMDYLDARETTRKLKVSKVSSLDFEDLTDHFIEIDKKGSPFGTLSPAVETEFSFNNSDFKVTYGSPSKRGRDIFGGIVSYGQRWRTGANRASHFSTSKALSIQGNNIPAGEYTLFSIPEENGGVLIINKQTGQNGRSYNQDQDLARVQMSRSGQDEITENFTIQVVETDSGGAVQLVWDQTVYSIEFTFN